MSGSRRRPARITVYLCVFVCVFVLVFPPSLNQAVVRAQGRLKWAEISTCLLITWGQVTITWGVQDSHARLRWQSTESILTAFGADNLIACLWLWWRSYRRWHDGYQVDRQWCLGARRGRTPSGRRLTGWWGRAAGAWWPGRWGGIVARGWGRSCA